MRRFVLIAVMTAAVVALTAGPALADPATPTNYRSRVTAMDPDPAGLAIQVTGGDAFLVTAVAEGHTLEIPGYFGEPYLRIDADGSVWRNQRSPATFINTDRYGTEIPPEADHTAPPEWVQVGSRGTYAWHDHRTHWMSRDLPPTIGGDRAQVIFPWEFSVTFDGDPVRVRGELVWFPPVNPFGPLVLGVVGLAPLIWWRPGRRALVALSLAVLASLALFVATMQYAATPVDRPFPSELIVPVLAVALAVGSLLLERSPIRAMAARMLAAAALVIWAISRGDVLTAPILPSALSPMLERSLVGIVMVSAVVYLAITVVDAVLTSRLADRTPAPSQPQEVTV